MVHKPSTTKAVISANCKDPMTTLQAYEPKIGAPFKVTLINSVEQRVDANGEIIETIIPNLDGLLKEIAFSRALDERKFSPKDIKFVRKAVGLKALDLADLLGVSPEHISRCEKGDRVLSIAAEKLLRVIVLKRRHNPAELATRLKLILEKDDLGIDQRKKISALLEKYRRTVEELETAIFDFHIQTVHEPTELEYLFEIVPPDESEAFFLDEDAEEEWRSSECIAA